TIVIGWNGPCACQEWKTCARSSSWARRPAARRSSLIVSAASAACVCSGVVVVMIAPSPRWVRVREASVVGGESEVETSVAGVEPACGHDLAAGEEVDSLFAVGMGVAEQRVLPSAEGVVAHWHGDRDVDADHA